MGNETGAKGMRQLAACDGQSASWEELFYFLRWLEPERFQKCAWPESSESEASHPVV